MKYDRDYWQAELKRAIESRKKTFYPDAEQSIMLYKGDNFKNSLNFTSNTDRRINIWWSLINTLLPAYFSKIPEVEARLRKYTGASESTVMASLFEKHLQYQIDEELNFDRLGTNAVIQWMVAGEMCLWVRVESEEEAIRITDPESDKKEKTIKRPRLVLDSLHYKDFLQPEMRDSDEVTWKARRAYLSEEEVKSMFGSKVIKDLDFTYIKGEEKNSYSDQGTAEQRENGKAELFEIWCKESKQVYFTSLSGDFFKKYDPPIKYVNFFPCVNLAASTGIDSNVPIGDYRIARDLILEVERLTSKAAGIMTCIKANFVFNKKLGREVQQLFDNDDGTGVPADLELSQEAMESLTAQGREPSAPRISDAIQFAPIREFVDAYISCIQARSEAMDRLYEVIPASDLIRGTSEGNKTATANQLESNYSGLRFSLRQKQLIRTFADAVQLMSEAVSQSYSFQNFFEVANGQEVIKNFPDLNVAVLQQLYKDIDMRCYKMEITTDSMVELDERSDRRERTDFMSSIAGYMQQLEPLLAKYPQATPALGEFVNFTARSYRGGKELEGAVQFLFKAMAQGAAQQQQQGQQDPKQGQEQARLQVAQINAQTEIQKAQMDAQAQREKAAMEARKQQAENALRQFELQVKLVELNIKRQEMGLEEVEMQLDLQSKMIQHEGTMAKIEAQMTKEALDTQQERIKADSEQTNIQIL